MNRILIICAVLATCFVLSNMGQAAGSLPLQAAVFALSLIALVVAADKFTDLAVLVGNSLGLSKLATGVLIIAIGTSAPEVFASISAAIRNQPSLVIGGVYGTIIANSLLGIGCAAAYSSRALIVHKEVFGTQMAVFMAAIFMSVGALYDGEINKFESAILLIILIGYLVHMMKSGKQPEDASEQEPETDTEKTVLLVPVLLLLVSLAALFYSGDLVVNSLIHLSEILEISSDKLATSVLAVGTSFPEIATAIALVNKNNADSLFGEIIGSNVFDILGIFGGIGLFMTLSMDKNLLVYLALSIVFVYVTINTVMNDKSINRLEGIALIGLFAIFTNQLINIQV